jgi:hypothetical protein
LIVIKEGITPTVDAASEKKYDVTDAESEQTLQSMRDDRVSLQQEGGMRDDRLSLQQEGGKSVDR